MTELLSKDHRILEKGLMEYRPFGVDELGEKIRDVSGVTVRANVEYLEDVIGRLQGSHAGSRAIEELACLLNARIRDPAYHVSPAFLKNPWNSYSYEFVWLGPCRSRPAARQTIKYSSGSAILAEEWSSGGHPCLCRNCARSVSKPTTRPPDWEI